VEEYDRWTTGALKPRAERAAKAPPTV